MKVVVQKCLEASVKVDSQVLNSISKGFVLLVGFTQTDTLDIVKEMSEKILKLRIFEDEFDIMNKSILDIDNTSILSISQFTLYGDTKKGNRPSYIKALISEEAVVLYDYFNKCLSEKISVKTGVFGADMKVSLINDGPTTIILEK